MKPDIEQIRNLGEFSTLYQWDVSFEGRSALNGFSVRCETTELPKSSGQTIYVPIRGVTVRQPGIYQPSGVLTMTFVETVDSVISTALSSWREDCGDMRTGAGKKPKDVEVTLTLIRLDRQNKPCYEYRIIGAFLEDVDLGSMDGSTSDVFRPVLVVAYQYFTEKKL